MVLSDKKGRRKEMKIKEEIKTEPSEDIRTDNQEEVTAAKNRSGDAHRKSWRLIIRNLPFNTTKEDLEAACSKYGPCTEIVLPKCKDKRYPNSCAGFAFVQFMFRRDSIQALEGLNMSEFKGRKIAVDKAIAKDTYETAMHEEREKNSVKKEDSEPVIKQEPQDEDSNDRSNIDSKIEAEDEGESSDSNERELNDQKTEKKRRDPVQDVALSEGRVVFVRNLSYEVDNNALKSNFENFGEINLAIICRFADSDHSKGTGFLHFARREDADKCIDALENEPGVFIEGRRVYGCRAVTKEEASAAEKERLEKKPKDKRNLALIRLTFIRPGTAAANGMSESDAAKRERMMLAAKQKLSNLHMFVSPTRLVVHNLPIALSDRKLRSICFLAAGNPDARILECRIWRDKERLDKKGMARSRGFAFVAFSTHIDALNCLKNLNNNPETFSDEKRPIVEFSIENLEALRIKENRLKRTMQGRESNANNEEKIKNEREVQKTKMKLSAGGQKPFPSHFGAKIRKHSVNNSKRQKTTTLKKGATKQEGRKRRLLAASSKEQKSKKLKLDKARLTKYLTLA